MDDISLSERDIVRIRLLAKKSKEEKNLLEKYDMVGKGICFWEIYMAMISEDEET